MPLSLMTDYISIRVILDSLLHHPLLQDLTLERAVAYAVDFIRVIGMAPIFTEKTAELEIENYRAALPCDYHEMIQVRTNHEKCGHSVGKVFRYSTDNFHMSDNKHEQADLTYKIQGRVIYTSIKEGTIEIAYRAIAVDDEGYPLIPDKSPFINALELYIKKKCFTILFDLGKINQAVLANVQQEYAWAVGQAQSDLIRPSIDEMQSITNSLNTLIPRANEHSKGFITDGSMERIKLQ